MNEIPDGIYTYVYILTWIGRMRV